MYVVVSWVHLDVNYNKLLLAIVEGQVVLKVLGEHIVKLGDIVQGSWNIVDFKKRSPDTPV